MAELLVNTARLEVRSSLDQPVDVLWQSDKCIKCSPLPLFTLSPESPANSTVLSTLYSSTTFVRVGPNETLDCQTPSLQNQAEYLIRVYENKSCDTTIETPATNEYLPLITVGVSHLAILLLICIYPILKKKFSAQEAVPVALPDEDAQSSSSSSADEEESFPPARVKSLDTFRGLTIFLMIFVNYGGGKLAIFEHSPWDGLTIADLVFPWFVWIMGTSIGFSMCSLRKKEVPTQQIFKKICIRTMKLVVLGLVLNSSGGHNDITKLRIPGVLQRIAISYFVVATLHMFRANPNLVPAEGICDDPIEHKQYWPESLVGFVLVGAHVAITFALPVPGCPTGYLGPGGLHEDGAYFNCTGGAAGYIDRLVLGSAHLYQHNTAHEIYHGQLPFDPEGLLGCLTSIYLTFSGLRAAQYLLIYRDSCPTLKKLFSMALAYGLFGVVVNIYIPINKNLWSLSYVSWGASSAFFLFLVLHIVVHALEKWSGDPFNYIGMNPVLIYVGHLMVSGMLPWFWNGPETHWRYLIMNLAGTYMWTIIAYLLHKHGLYLSL